MFTKIFAQVVLALLLIGGLVSAQYSLPAHVNTKILNGNVGTCPAEDQLEEARAEISSNVSIILTKYTAFKNPASPCASISQDSPSGYYWIETADGSSATQVFCDTTRTCGCNNTGNWMRVANLNMTDPTQECPPEFHEITTPRRTCGRPDNVRTGCVSTTFPVNSIPYSRVCGKVRGYQLSAPLAFGPHSYQGQATIDHPYVDGFSITHGSPRNHIWTFAAAADEWYGSDINRCPCIRPDQTYPGTIPPFVGQDYFCETGSRERWRALFYTEDPLWDGQGCGSASTCCNHPLYFCKQLPQPTTDSIELRLCGSDHSGEDSPLEIVEIYVQ